MKKKNCLEEKSKGEKSVAYMLKTNPSPSPPPPKLECFSMRVDNFTGWIHQLYTYSPGNSKNQSENLEEAKINKYLRNFFVTQPVTSRRFLLWVLDFSVLNVFARAGEKTFWLLYVFSHERFMTVSLIRSLIFNQCSNSVLKSWQCYYSKWQYVDIRCEIPLRRWIDIWVRRRLWTARQGYNHLQGIWMGF